MLDIVDKPAEKMPLRDVVAGSQSYEAEISALQEKLYEHGSVIKVGYMFIGYLGTVLTLIGTRIIQTQWDSS